MKSRSRISASLQEVFMGIVAIPSNLVRRSGHAAAVAEDHSSLRQMSAVAQLLSRKVEGERKYLARLEGEE